VVGLDWNTHPELARKWVPNKVFQGNLDPCMLYANPQVIRENVTQMINDFGGRHIVNLGHGVYPDTPLDNVKVFVDTDKSYQYAGVNA
ncbi:MAG: uroporphyrinogen decarboxylase family protein, partial [Saprospiraceae bacterium]